MSRETLLDDAIAKAKEAEDWQLVEWLRMARGGESAARWYSDKLREAHRTERKLLDENAKLREQGERLFDKTLELGTENAKLRELVRDMWHEGMCECGSLGKCATCIYEYPTRMRKLGVEVDG